MDQSQDETLIYARCMSDVNQRVAVIRSTVAEVRKKNEQTDQQVELIFIQFRKILEQIAFGSLTANRKRYIDARRQLAEEWNATDLIKAMEKLNPKFYPEPLKGLITRPDGVKHMERLTDGFLTKKEFVRLYVISSEILHTQNPFSGRDPIRKIGHSIDEWVERIENLLRWHLIQLVDGQIWVVNMPRGHRPTVFTAKP